MQPAEVMEALLEIAASAEIEVRSARPGAPADGDWITESGVCRLRGRLYVVLSPAADASRVISLERIYTGITRARSRVDIVAEAEVVKAGIEKMAERVSGLGGTQE